MMGVRSVKSTRVGGFDWLEKLEIVPQIRGLIAEGERNTDIARRLGISDRTVLRHRAQMRREGLIR